ncbi:hypothetical protein [uncultured Thiodictyon sp.]|uniref:hypothetical protein n=1 Tax=uncultured Thiodictyon sp. TaxID=1846217 RepID=UPI0025F8721E|nr:hypothetical protein [uncultured Thiodictyon sp.]
MNANERKCKRGLALEKRQTRSEPERRFTPLLYSCASAFLQFIPVSLKDYQTTKAFLRGIHNTLICVHLRSFADGLSFFTQDIAS